LIEDVIKKLTTTNKDEEMIKDLKKFFDEECSKYGSFNDIDTIYEY